MSDPVRASVIRLSLHPSNPTTPDGYRYLRLTNASGQVFLCRTFPAHIRTMSVVVPRDASTAVSIGTLKKRGSIEIDWSHPVMVDPRSNLTSDPSLVVRVTASKEFESQEAAEKYLASGKSADDSPFIDDEKEPVVVSDVDESDELDQSGGEEEDDSLSTSTTTSTSTSTSTSTTTSTSTSTSTEPPAE